jgi:hypothetical protein
LATDNRERLSPEPTIWGVPARAKCRHIQNAFRAAIQSGSEGVFLWRSAGVGSIRAMPLQKIIDEPYRDWRCLIAYLR